MTLPKKSCHVRDVPTNEEAREEMLPRGRDWVLDKGFGNSRSRFPANYRLPAYYRLLDDVAELAPADPQARDLMLARLEAALMLADEPLPARKLAAIADLASTAEARELLEH